MGIASKPTNTYTTTLQSTEGLNMDLWQSLDLTKYLPEPLQKVIDEITKLLNKVQAILEYALEALKLASDAAFTIFSFVRSVLELIRKTIIDLLDMFPMLEAGVYLLYIPLGFGGNDYYLKTFKDSLYDSRDLRKPPSNPDSILDASFLMWGYPWYDKTKQKAVKSITSTIRSLFAVDDNIVDFVELDPHPTNVTIESGFYPKVKTVDEKKDSRIAIPQSYNPTSDEVQKFIRASINHITRTSDTAALGYTIKWELPKDFGRFSLKAFEYSKQHNASELDFIFKRQEYQIHGLYILRATSITALKLAIKKVETSPPGINTETATEIETGIPEKATLICVSPTRLKAVNYYTDYPAELKDSFKQYFYAVATAYTHYVQTTGAWANKTNGTYYVKRIAQYNPQSITDLYPSSDEDVIDSIDFSKVHPKDVKYYTLSDEELETIKSTQLSTSSFQISSGGHTSLPSTYIGTPPNWASFKVFEDLFPEIKEAIEKIRTFVDNLVDSVLDDVDAFEDWVNAQINKIERILQEAIAFVEKLKSLIFPPMTGVHYLNVHTTQGSQGSLDRLEKSLEYALLPTSNSYNPVLLDKDFQKENPEEFNRRKHIPAYDRNHVTGGLVLVFQEPAVKKFLDNLLDIPNSFSDAFKAIVNDSTQQLRNLSMPSLTYQPPDESIFTYEQDQDVTSPDAYMVSLSKHNSGQKKDVPEVNSSGNVEIVSKKGPFIFTEPTVISIATEEEQYTATVIPQGTLSAEQIVALINKTQTPLAYTMEDGSFVLEGKSLFISSCSVDAASILGLIAGMELKGPETPTVSQFNYDNGDYLVEFVDEGPPTIEMLGATPPIFQLNQADLTNLSPTACYLKFTIENVTKIIDVTGNLGANPTNKSAKWTFTANYPLQIQKDQNDKFSIQITTTNQTLIDKYKNVSSDWSKAITEFEAAYKKEFTNELQRPNPEVSQQQHTVTLPPSTYKDPTALGAAILTQLHGIREVDLNKDGVQDTADEQAARATRVYPIGLLTVVQEPLQQIQTNTISNQPQSFTASLQFLDQAAHNAETTLQVAHPISPYGTLDSFLNSSAVTANQNIAGTTKVVYELDTVVNNLNTAFFPKVPFSVENNIIRITGTEVGKMHSIKVFCSKDPIPDEPQSSHYSQVARALFKIPTQQYNFEVFGLGYPIASHSYYIEMQKEQFCLAIEEAYKHTTELFDTPVYTIELVDNMPQKYTIDLIKVF